MKHSDSFGLIHDHLESFRDHLQHATFSVSALSFYEQMKIPHVYPGLSQALYGLLRNDFSLRGMSWMMRRLQARVRFVD